jgi:anaerobic magnesium-protoporphyrin IX monomethyl ester cyclase
MKILFVNSRQYLSIGINGGIAGMSTSLKLRGHETGLFDTTFLKTKSDAENMKKLNELGTTMQFKRTEYSLEDLVMDDPIVDHCEVFQGKIDEFKPDVIAVSAMTEPFDNACNLLRNIKSDAITIVGGVHPTIAPEDAISQNVFDIVCIGEADNTFPELLDLIQKGEDHTGVKSMWFRQSNGSIIKNLVPPRVQLDNLDTPDWGLFDKRHLFRPYLGEIYVGSFYQQSRGCPNKCSYCVDPTLATLSEDGTAKGYFRVQDPSVTIKHLTELNKNLGVNFIRFGDDTFFMAKLDHLKALHKGIKPLGIKFSCSIFHTTISEEKIEISKDMGLVAISAGVESGSPVVRKRIKRNYTNTQLVENFDLLHKYEIRTTTTNLIGLPDETRENVFETIELNRKLHTTGGCFIVYPYPGTKIYDDYKVSLRDKDGKMIPVSKAKDFSFSKMSPDELVGLMRTFNLYLHLPKAMWPVIKLAESDDDFGISVLKKLLEVLTDHFSNTNTTSKKLSDMAKGKPFRYEITDDILVPVSYERLFDLPLSQGAFNVIIKALEDINR